MRNNNLAYHADDRYRKIYDNREIRKITNIRSTGGVMIKTGSGQKRKVNTAAGRNRRPKSRINRGTVISVIVLASMAFLVLFRGLMITSGYEQLEKKNTTLSETIAENQKLQFKIDQTLDLKNIEKIAQNTFNMGQPSKSQTIYINLEQSNEVKKVRSGNSIIDAVKNFFSGIVEYFA